MKTPVHHWKERVTYADGREPHWTFDGKPCWLASGLYDRNGKEIIEGDIIKIISPPDCWQDDMRRLVIFRNGEFLSARECYWSRLETCGATPLPWEGLTRVEIVGHIAEEQQ